MNIEKLTDAERNVMLANSGGLVPKTLRIIDAQAAALAEARAECERLRALHEQALNERDAAHNAIGEWEYLRNDAYRRFRASESKLAAAEALLRKVYECGCPLPLEVLRPIRDYLSKV